jgi:hypothetical protein
LFVTPLVVPAVPPRDAGSIIARLTPIFLDGEERIMVAQCAGAIPKHVLGPAIASLPTPDFEIAAALDMLISGVLSRSREDRT